MPTPLNHSAILETASDNEFADIEGDDGAPEFALGRLPVASVAEAEAVVAKILRYEAASLEGNPRILFVGDRSEEFQWMQTELAGSLGPSHRHLALWLGDLEVPELHRRLQETWGDGVTFVYYSGHGSRTTWSQEEILTTADIPSLVPPSSHFPVVVALNCLNGFFHHPASPSLGEALLLTPEAGAIAYWGPTGLSSHLGQKGLATELMAHLAAHGRGTLGSSLQHALRAVAADSSRRALVDSWILLGDPALRLRR